MDFEALWELLQQAGLPGIVVGVLVLAFVYVGTATDLFKTGTLKRLAVMVASVLFAGVPAGGEKEAIVAAIGMAFATLAKLVIDGVVLAIKARKK